MTTGASLCSSGAWAQRGRIDVGHLAGEVAQNAGGVDQTRLLGARRPVAKQLHVRCPGGEKPRILDAGPGQRCHVRCHPLETRRDDPNSSRSRFSAAHPNRFRP